MDRHQWLDLGDVQAFAEVKLNGKPLGVLWKPPYRLDVSDIVTPGRNSLKVSLTNLWPNRMIGDEQLPEDSERNRDGTLRRWPDWLQQGKPSPTGRQTFTTWRLWKKDDRAAEVGIARARTADPVGDGRVAKINHFWPPSQSSLRDLETFLFFRSSQH